jgi:PTH1 family peptidyl-tRNA hydrolase
MLILAGLGNPGAKYAGNRHNIGFMAVDAIASRWRFGPERSRFHSLTAEGVIDTPTGPVRVLLMKPQTFMNESGVAVGEAVKFLKLTPADVVVFHDELDLADGRFRMKAGGGAAGHNGLRSITSRIGPDFRRARLGVGHPGHKDLVLGHVLSDFTKSEQAWVEGLCKACAEAAPLLAQGQDEKYQTEVARLAPAAKLDPRTARS